jgi:hypothetical protein
LSNAPSERDVRSLLTTSLLTAKGACLFDRIWNSGNRPLKMKVQSVYNSDLPVHAMKLCRAEPDGFLRSRTTMEYVLTLQAGDVVSIDDVRVTILAVQKQRIVVGFDDGGERVITLAAPSEGVCGVPSNHARLIVAE